MVSSSTNVLKIIFFFFNVCRDFDGQVLKAISNQIPSNSNTGEALAELLAARLALTRLQ
jgi:hypothetical protein